MSLHFLTSDRLRAFSLKPLWQPKDQVLQIYLNEKKKLIEDFFVVEIVVKGKKIQLENNAQSNSIRLAILQRSRGPPVLVYFFRLRNNCNLLQQRRSETEFKQYLNERRRNDYLFYEA